MDDKLIRLTVNGRDEAVVIQPLATLQDVLRDNLELTAVKSGCGQGGCGSCSVLVDGGAATLLPHARRAGRGGRDHHAGGPQRDQRDRAAAAGLRRELRGAVRLLHRRHGDGGQGAARPQSVAEPRRDRGKGSRAISAAAPGSRPSSARCSRPQRRCPIPGRRRANVDEGTRRRWPERRPARPRKPRARPDDLLRGRPLPAHAASQDAPERGAPRQDRERGYQRCGGEPRRRLRAHPTRTCRARRCGTALPPSASGRRTSRSSPSTRCAGGASPSSPCWARAPRPRAPAPPG